MTELAPIEPVPDGWVALERHLVGAHRFEEADLETLTTDDERRLHYECHVASRFTAGRQHVH